MADLMAGWVCRLHSRQVGTSWMDVFALPENANMAVTESDPDPKVRKMSITL